jgi:hypothetical protein
LFIIINQLLNEQLVLSTTEKSLSDRVRSAPLALFNAAFDFGVVVNFLNVPQSVPSATLKKKEDNKTCL